jgi:hypothetical protein
MPRTPRLKAGASVYDVHPGVQMVQKWVAELKEKTGRTLEEWLAFIRESGPTTEKERRVWLKKEYGLGTNTAWWLAERAGGDPLGLADDDPESYLKAAPQYVEVMFSGAKEGLRPLYEALLKLGRSLGKDVKVCPCKTIVPLYRNHVIAQIKPTTRTRIDFGLALTDTPASGRLIDTGGFAKKDRITHRIPITRLEEIDDEVRHWLQVAFDLDA